MTRRHSGIHVPPECLEMIRTGALVAISTSGGKDSQAMTILLSRIVPREQQVAVHAPLACRHPQRHRGQCSRMPDLP